MFIWADTQDKGIVDRAPNTDASDGCADPELDTEVLTLSLVPPTCDVPGGSCLVFVTSTTHTGNLGGLAGADAICQARADAAGLGGTFRAWLSDSTTAARDRLTRAGVPYVRVDGVQVAANFADLTDGALMQPILLTEGGAVDPQGAVWTGTTPAGELSVATCLDWRSGGGADGGVIGESFERSREWTERCNPAPGFPPFPAGPCGGANRSGCANRGGIYCFEQ